MAGDDGLLYLVNRHGRKWALGPIDLFGKEPDQAKLTRCMRSIAGRLTGQPWGEWRGCPIIADSLPTNASGWILTAMLANAVVRYPCI
jgi:hypothetical protein